MNKLLYRGSIFLVLLHPFLSIYILNILFVMAFHESLHLAVYRKLTQTHDGVILISSFSLHVSLVHQGEWKALLLSALAPMFMGPFGLVVSVFLKSLYLSLLCLPWSFNCINLFWFSPDMKTIRRAINNL